MSAAAAATTTSLSTTSPTSSPPPQAGIIPIGAAYLGSTPSSLCQASASAGGEDLGPTVFNPKTLTSRGKVRLPVHALPWREEHSRSSLKSNSRQQNGTSPAKDAEETLFGVYYELHGKGPKKIVFLMGLNTSCFGWLPQVEYFSQKPDEYSLLVLDNRGYGNSDAPPGRYSTSQMAQDALALMASPQIGFLDRIPDPHPASPYASSSSSSSSTPPGREARKVHLVGVSMGGMMTLELCKRYAHVFKSITLISTTSGRARGAADVRDLVPPPSIPPSSSEEKEEEEGVAGHLIKRITTGLPPLNGISTIARIMTGRLLGMDSDAYRIEKFTTLLFPSTWLDAPSQKIDEANRVLREELAQPELQFFVDEAHRMGKRKATNREWFKEMFLWRYRYTRKQTLHGAFAQMSAALTHRVKNSDLQFINTNLPSIAIVTGDQDNLVNPKNSAHLKANMPSAKYVCVQGGGHALPMQCPDRINELIEQTVEKGEKAAAAAA